jgi:hypothetical protein
MDVYNQMYFCAGMLFWKFFVKRMQAGTAFQNLVFLAVVKLTPPLSVQMLVTLCIAEPFSKEE